MPRRCYNRWVQNNSQRLAFPGVGRVLQPTKTRDVVAVFKSFRDATKEKTSLHSRKIHNNYWLLALLASLGLAALLTAITYPGVLYSDTYGRWNLAGALLHGERHPTYLSVLPQLVMALTLKVSGGYAAFTFLQCFFYLFTSLLLVHRVCGRHTLWVAVLFLLCPITLAYSVFQEMGVGCLTGMNVLILGLLAAPAQQNKKERLPLFALLMALAAAVCFGFRQNAFTVLPVLLGAAIVGIIQKRDTKKKDTKKKVAFVVGVLVGLLFALTVPVLLGVARVQASSVGFAWETLLATNRLPEEEKTEYTAYYDDLAGEGATQEALLAVKENDRSVNAFVWGRLNHGVMGTPEGSRMVMERNLAMWRRHPKKMLDTKLWMAGKVLGLSGPIGNLEYDYNTWDRMLQYGMRDTALRKNFVAGFNAFMNSTGIFLRPWLWFVLAGLVLLYQKMSRRPLNAALLLFLCAVFYYGAFLVNTQSFEFRYFFPAFQLLGVVVAMGAVQLVEDLIKKMREDKNPHPSP